MTVLKYLYKYFVVTVLKKLGVSQLDCSGLMQSDDDSKTVSFTNKIASASVDKALTSQAMGENIQVLMNQEILNQLRKWGRDWMR